MAILLFRGTTVSREPASPSKDCNESTVAVGTVTAATTIIANCIHRLCFHIAD